MRAIRSLSTRPRFVPTACAPKCCSSARALSGEEIDGAMTTRRAGVSMTGQRTVPRSSPMTGILAAAMILRVGSASGALDTPACRINHYYTKESHRGRERKSRRPIRPRTYLCQGPLRSPSSKVFLGEWKPEMNVNLNTETQRIGDSHFEVALTVTA